MRTRLLLLQRIRNQTGLVGVTGLTRPPLHLGRVGLPGPLDLPASLTSLTRSGDDLCDRWDGHTLVRVLTVSGRPVPAAMRPVGGRRKPALDTQVSPQPEASTAALRQAVGRQFVTADASWAALLADDRALAGLDAAGPGVRPLAITDPFYALVRAITAQQVNLRWAVTVRARIADRFGEVHHVGAQEVRRLDPDRIAGASVAQLRELQLSGPKVEYLIGVAAAAADGQLDLAELDALADAEVLARLTALRGIGRWSADWFLARVLRRPAVAAGDLAVRKAVGWLYRQPAVPSERQARRLTGHWGTAAGVAQQVVLEAFSASGR